MAITGVEVDAVTLEIELCLPMPSLEAKATRRVTRNRTLLLEFVATSLEDIASSETNASTCTLLLRHLAQRIREGIEVVLGLQAPLDLGRVAVAGVVKAVVDLATHVLGRVADPIALMALRGLANTVATSEVEAKLGVVGPAEAQLLPQHLLPASRHMC